MCIPKNQKDSPTIKAQQTSELDKKVAHGRKQTEGGSGDSD